MKQGQSSETVHVYPVDEVEGKDEPGIELEAQEEEEDAVVVPSLPTPNMPTLSQVLEHNVTHCPYRVWCRHCVEGRGREFGHLSCRPCEPRGAPTVSFDYAFIGDKGEITSQEQADTEIGAAKLLVVRDSKSKAVFGHVVPVKGIDEKGFSVDAVVDCVQWLGYSRVVLKSDNEPAIVVLLQESLRQLKVHGLDQVMAENSPEYDPQANGNAEVGVKLLKGMFRTHRSCLEERIGFRIPAKHPIMTWLVRHVGDIMNWTVKGHDGKTAYERVRGKEFRTRLPGFGELVRYKLRAQEPIPSSGDGRRFHVGPFVGIDRRTGQYMIHGGDGIKMARTIMRLPEANKFDKEELSKISATPFDLHRARDLEVVFKDKAAQGEEVFKERVALARQPYIMKKDLEEFGLTRGCARCDHQLQYGTDTSKPHSQRCRARITEELSKTVTGKARIAAAAERLDRTVAEMGQQFRADAPQGEKDDVGRHLPEQPPQLDFLPLDRPVEHATEHESREVPPPTDEPGGGETHGFGFESADQAREDVDPGMDIDVVDTDISGDRGTGEEENSETELRELMAVMTKDFQKEIREHERDIVDVIKALGGCSRRYKRERSKAINTVVSEIYSPPRVTAATKLLPELRLIPGFALDLTTSDVDGRLWDFDDKVMRDRAMQKVLKEKPMLLIGSPMCTAFSTWQYINNKVRSPVTVAAELKRAKMHLEFCIELYRVQSKNGRYFLHEHPAYATSWQTDMVEGLMREEGTLKATCDQCLYGCEAEDGSPVKKPTSFMTNSPELVKELSARCGGRGGRCSRPEGGEHRQCRGRTARMVAMYHFKLCRAILVGFRNQLRCDGICKDGYIGMLEGSMERTECAPMLHIMMCDQVLEVEIDGEKVYRDDLTGQVLDSKLVKEARQKELDFFEAKEVWIKKRFEEAKRRTGKPPISVRWVDVTEADDINPNIRSRFVARQIRQPGEEAIFAPTPPLEALRTILSLASTDIAGRRKHVREANSERRTQISAIDISRAYFNASMDETSEPTYVMLPPEHPGQAEGYCGLLRKHMYGTRAAADGWQQEYSGYMREIGFRQGVASPCIFVHEARGIACSVHGDDFTSTGEKRELDWLEAKLESKYELRKGGRLGPGNEDAKELTVLNRVLRYTVDGFEYEADPRQAEKLLEGLHLDGGCNGAATPGQKAQIDQLEKDQPIPVEGHTEFRGLSARSNYLSADRVDLQFAAKEICRFMSCPMETSMGSLKRMGRYLLGHQRLVYMYPWQQADGIDVYSDTDWSGCPRTRRSTSGGCVMLGRHVIRTWSSTQPSVTLSSGEAEFYGLVKAAGAGLGHQSIMEDFGLKTPVRVWTDSSAALGISTRSGLGKLRHLETHTLWVQEKVRTGAIEVRKVRGDVNPADLFTKHLPSKEKIHQLVKLFGCEYRTGRSTAAPLLRPQGVGGGPGGQPATAHLPTFVTEEEHEEAHDIEQLPHMYERSEMDRLFKVLGAPPAGVNVEDWREIEDQDLGEMRGC